MFDFVHFVFCCTRLFHFACLTLEVQIQSAFLLFVGLATINVRCFCAASGLLIFLFLAPEMIPLNSRLLCGSVAPTSIRCLSTTPFLAKNKAGKHKVSISLKFFNFCFSQLLITRGWSHTKWQWDRITLASESRGSLGILKIWKSLSSSRALQLRRTKSFDVSCVVSSTNIEQLTGRR